MIARGIRAFVSRDWAAVRQSKDMYWRDRISRLGRLEAFRVAEELRRQAVLADAGWPSAALRRDDIHFHVRMAERFRRAAPARRR